MLLRFFSIKKTAFSIILSGVSILITEIYVIDGAFLIGIRAVWKLFIFNLSGIYRHFLLSFLLAHSGYFVSIVPIPYRGVRQQAAVSILDIFDIALIHQFTQLVFTNAAESAHLLYSF